jgi:hypothetical protein
MALNYQVKKGLDALLNRINKDTGMIHPSDRNAALSLFYLFSRNGYKLDGVEISLFKRSCCFRRTRKSHWFYSRGCMGIARPIKNLE